MGEGTGVGTLQGGASSCSTVPTLSPTLPVCILKILGRRYYFLHLIKPNQEQTRISESCGRGSIQISLAPKPRGDISTSDNHMVLTADAVDCWTVPDRS